jgi:two-component system sensor histidine kinase BarA
VVEDHDLNRMVTERRLINMGARVVSVQSGRAALKALMERPGSVDLVLMDLRMPEMDGRETTRRIRQLPGKLSEIPVVALSAHAKSEEEAACLEAGMSAYLTKPFTEEELLAITGQLFPCPLSPQSEREDATGPDPAAKPPAEAASSVPTPTLAEDWPRLAAMVGNEEAVLTDMLNLAYDELNACLADIAEAEASLEPDAWQNRAHRLKTTAHHLDAPALRDQFRAIEHAADANTPPDTLKTLLLDIQPLLRDLLGRLETSIPPDHVPDNLRR